MGALGLPYHYELVSDKERVTPFRRAIQQTCKNKRVLESGTGSAMLSILAAKVGAKKVYTVEIDPKIARFAKENIKKSGFQKRIKLIQKDTLNLTLKDLDNQKVDIAIAENLSTWQVTEPQISIMNYINKFLLKENGVPLPSQIFNYLELAQSKYRFEDVIDLRTRYFGFTGIKKPKTLSKRELFTKIDLRKQNHLTIDKTIKVKVTKAGTLNSLRLTSPLRVFGKITFNSSDSLMPPVIIPLRKDIFVSKGESITLNIKYRHNTDWSKFRCEAKLMRS